MTSGLRVIGSSGDSGNRGPAPQEGRRSRQVGPVSLTERVSCCSRRRRMLSRFAVSLLCAVFLNQSAFAAPITFHISGTVTQNGKAFPHQWVTFDGTSPRSVQADEDGFFEADLPLGVWKVTATMRPYNAATPIGASDNPTFSRPHVFRVTEPRDLVVDVFLWPPVLCDVRVVTPNGQPATPEEREGVQAVCDGEEFFSVPSADGVPFELIIGGRKKDLRGSDNREFAVYNLLTVRADDIVYNPLERILEASGNVVIRDGSEVHRGNSAAFEIWNGRARSVR
jgi:hypothetical protein